jgi:hypothetical protein
LEIEEFQRCINLGLGRVILYLQNHSSELYRNAILHACLHNTIYDRKLENNKGEYLREIIRLSGEETFYRQQVIEALKIADTSQYNRDISHLLDIAGCFAKEGDSEARQILYKLFDANINTDEYGFDSRLVDVDRLSGFLYVIERLLESIAQNSDYFEDETLIWDLEEVIGKETAEAKLAELRQTNLKLDSYLKLIETHSLSRKTPKRGAEQPSRKSNFGELNITSNTWTLSDSQQWGREADEDSLIRAAIDLENETNPLLLKKYLAIFFRKAYPRAPQVLFLLTAHEDFQISAKAFHILAHTQDPAIREFALQEIAKERNIGRAIGLLERNFKENDWELIEAATEKQLEENDYHSIQSNVRDIFEAHPSPKAIKSLLNLYEYGVCSFCRFRILEHLGSLDALPESIRQECFYDSNDDIREWAKNGFKLKRG